MAVPRIAIRCDGGATMGAGHVGRCRPIALAFRQAGWYTAFLGTFDGLAAWMVQTSGLPVHAPVAATPCGVDPHEYDAAIVDLYGAGVPELCTLAAALPMATLGEASRCPSAGVLIDYHLDRTAAQDQPRLLAGPTYAPVDPAFAALEQAGEEVRCALVTLGGSAAVRAHAEPVVAAVAELYPTARLLLAAGLPAPEGIAVERPQGPANLIEPARAADLAVTAAGMTAYELACAGVPFLALVVADNQARVGRALEAAGLGSVLDVRGGLDERRLRERLAELAPAEVRRARAAAGRRAIDGRGAARIVEALTSRWGLGPG